MIESLYTPIGKSIVTIAAPASAGGPRGTARPLPPPLAAEGLERLNGELREASARRVVERTFERAARPIVSTSFGPDSAVLLALVRDVRADATVVWVDTGHHTRATRRFAERLTAEWDLDVRVYRPRHAPETLAARFGGVPGPDDPAHADFAEAVKLEPFRRALAELDPDCWITGIRAEETGWRRTLDVASAGPGGLVKIAPLLHWTREDVERFRLERGLPGGHDYHDVVKAGPKRECGLHDRL